jgi:lipopolysaccharide export system permease protein
MKTVRRLLYREILGSVAFVATAFLALFFFIDFVDELNDRGRPGFTTWRATQLALWELPGHLYELIPISVLIGTIYALSRMAQSSEFTILRTGGLGPGRALRLLATLGLGFALLTWFVGDHATPWAERQIAWAKAGGVASGSVGNQGAWLKDKQLDPQGQERSLAIQVGAARDGGRLALIRIFEHDALGQLRMSLRAEEGRVDDQGVWHLSGVQRTTWPTHESSEQAVKHETLPTLDWPSNLSANVVAAAVLPLATMTTDELWRYSSHLTEQAQDAQRYAIQFWKKALYPLACVVMVALALPFAYLQARSGGLSLKVFGGIMLGISFVLLNHVAGHLGILRGWTPWVAAAAPAIAYVLMSMLAFGWLVRYR